MSAALRFCGRSQELKELIERWRLASDVDTPSPQVVVVKAERGVGKTRLVLELYRWLSEEVDRSGYWPDALSIVDRNLAVNPEPESCKIREQRIPYLWWGVRSTDPGRENSVAGDAIATYDRYLAPHLVALLVRENAQRTRKAVAQVWAEAIGDAVVSELPQLLKCAIPYFDLAVGVGKVIYKTQHVVRESIDHGSVDKALEKPRSRADRALKDLERTFSPKSSSFAKTPGIIFIDDAQFASTDAALLSFGERLIHQALSQKWPMMIVATHWRQEFAKEGPNAKSFAGVIRHARIGGAGGEDSPAGLPGGHLEDKHYCEIDLRVVDDLSPALAGPLPGLTAPQANAIVERAGGNPRFLEQIIAFLLEENEGCFEDYDVSKPLTAEGLAKCLEETQDIFKVVLRRLGRAPVEVQEAICLASMQGMQFSNSLTEEFAHATIKRSVRQPLAEAENPYSMVTSHGPSEARTVGEFAERLFFDVAKKRLPNLPNLRDDMALFGALRNVLSARLDDMSLDAKLDVDDRTLTYRLAARIFEVSSAVGDKVKALIALVDLAVLQGSQSRSEEQENTVRRLGDLLISAPDAAKAAPDRVIEYASSNYGFWNYSYDDTSQDEWSTLVSIRTMHLDRQRALATRLDTEDAWSSAAWAFHYLAASLMSVSTENRETAINLHHEALAIRHMLVERFPTPEAVDGLLWSLELFHGCAENDLTERIGFLEEELIVARKLESDFPNRGLSWIAERLLAIITAYTELHDVSAAMNYLPELETIMAKLEHMRPPDPLGWPDTPDMLTIGFIDMQKKLRGTQT